MHLRIAATVTLATVAVLFLGCSGSQEPAPARPTADANAASACQAWKQAAGENLPRELLIGRIADIQRMAAESDVTQVRTAADALHASVDDAVRGNIRPFSAAAIRLHEACDALD